MIVPTRRAVMLLALSAPAALLIAALAPAAWIVAPALGLTLLALVVGDAIAAGRLADLTLDAPREAEVGGAARLAVSAAFSRGARRAVEAALGGDARLLPGGRAELALVGEGDAWRGEAAFAPTRRGVAPIDRLWLRWTGPLGLGARQASRAQDAAVGIVPNLAEVRSPALQAYLRDSPLGLVARRLRGEGSEFEALVEYVPGVESRRIDWKSSARHTQLYARAFETERNAQIVFALDCGRAMCEPVAGMPRIDRAVSAALATAYVALKGGDRAALFGFAAKPELATPFVAEPTAFHRLRSAAASLDYRAEEPNFTFAFAALAERLRRRSLVVVFSEFTDPTGAELMTGAIQRLVDRHVVLFVTLTDVELEGIAAAAPTDLAAMAGATTADALLRQRALALRELRRLGVDVLEAPHERIGTRLIDAYLAIKHAGVIG